MKKYKSLVLFLIVVLSLGISSNIYGRERNGSSGREREDRGYGYGSRGDRDRKSGKERNYGSRLEYDGKTTGIGRGVGSAIGGRYGRETGSRVGGELGDRLERQSNRMTHDRWNDRGRKGNSGWRL